MSYQHTAIPETGDKIRVVDDRLSVTDQPILGYVEGDGIGPDITRACLRIWDAAVERAYAGRRKVHWAELYMGEKAAGLFDGDYFPQETRDALRDLVVSIKGPLTTPVGGGFRSLNVGLRQVLDLYACVRPVRYYEGVPSPLRRARESRRGDLPGEHRGRLRGHRVRFPKRREPRSSSAFSATRWAPDFFEDAGLARQADQSLSAHNRLVRKAIQLRRSRTSAKSVCLGAQGQHHEVSPKGAFRNWGYELARDRVRRADGDGGRSLSKSHGGKRPPEGKVVIKDRIADIIFQLMLLRPSGVRRARHHRT